MTITQPLRTRRTHSEAFKQSLIEACGEPGASVAGVALANGINANQLRRWMRERGIEPPELSCLPLRVAASEPMGGFVPVQLSPSVDPPIRVELRKGTAVVTVDWPASSAATLHPVDRFFMQVRRRLSLAERAISSAGNQGRVWNGYAAYRPGNLVEALEIFRVYYNFCQCGDDKMTPAMRLGLARGPVAVEDILDFVPAAVEV